MKSNNFLLLLFVIVSISSCSRQHDFEEPVWYAFEPEKKNEISKINMTNWLDAPAGKHGMLTLKDDEFVFENGEKIKFWGVNINSARPYAEKDVIDEWVPFLTKYGINSVRFHKYTQHGMSDEVSTELKPEKWERFDYFQNQLREAGIYYGWSPIYGHKLRPGDRNRLLAYDEIVNAEMGNHLTGSTIGLVNFAEDIQDLHIELIVNKLNHVNPHTGLRYAEDPALIFVEFQNEDNIFFSTTDRMLENCPTYKNLITDKFTQWLRAKYTNHDGLLQAWGKEAIEWGEEVRKTTWNLDEGNITPVAGHGIYDYEYKQAEKAGEPVPLFLLDMARFLYEEQMKFYRKFEKAVRETGYEGPLVGSCWQAGSGVTHFYNLHTDAEMGIVDRHNYFGGGTGHRLVPGTFNNSSMLGQPGSGLLSSSMQQVDNRPFALSEWLSLIPNEWVAEAPVIMALYGLGLQGWDASYSFAVDHTGFTETVHTPNVYNVTSPTQITLYPALVSTIYNGDLKEGEDISYRNVHIPSLKQGEIGFTELQSQNWDEKEFGGGFPIEALAKGRSTVRFTDEFEPTSFPDLSDEVESGTITANTGQLKWNFDGEKGSIYINTPSLQGFTGFSQQENIKLDQIELQVGNEFAVVLVSSLEKDKTLSESGRWLITTVARAQNTGMEFNEQMTEILDVGEAPIQMESVNFAIRFKDQKPNAIRVLDHTGYVTGETIPVSSKELVINGNQHKTIYYEVIF